MNKFVCDLCGTSYPENATQCPICGSVRSADAVSVTDNPDSGSYTYVKGGRFSKSNVRKRNQTVVTEPDDDNDDKSNKKFIGLLLVLIALIVVVAFMVTMILITWKKQQDQQNSGYSDTQIPCTGVTLSTTEITLTSVDEIWLLDVSVSPKDCTDQILFYSKNPAVASVSDSGKITCLAEGEAVIIVECGGYSARCTVTCKYPEETTLPTVAPEGIHLNRMSITADFEGFTWKLYDDSVIGAVPANEITWISDDPSVATFTNGVVEAISEGKTMIHAEYNGVRTSCEVICDFTTEEETTIDEGEPAVEYVLYTMYNTQPSFNESVQAYDITLSMKEGPVSLFLKDNQGNKIKLEWSIVEGNDNGSVSVDGTYVKVNNSISNVKIKAEYLGVTYYCYIRTIN